MFPNQFARGCIKDDRTGEDTTDALLDWDNLWSVFCFWVE